MGLSIGKQRGLAQCSMGNGVFSILALDHRNNLRRAMNPANPDEVPDTRLTTFKSQIVRHLGDYTSAILLDPEVSAAQSIAHGDFPHHRGLIVAVEQTGYSGDPSNRVSAVLPGWSVEKVKRMGANGVKLLVYYHPKAAEARVQETLVEEVGEACRKFDLPFFLEPLSYSLDPGKRLSSQEKRQVVIETAKRLTPLGVDVLKAEFPLQIEESSKRTDWSRACQALSEASEVPWVLLSAGVGFEDYFEQVEVACRAGASGVMAGRAVWKEAVDLQGAARQRFLDQTARDRMNRLASVCTALGRPWTDFYPAEDLPLDWYSEYKSMTD